MQITTTFATTFATRLTRAAGAVALMAAAISAQAATPATIYNYYVAPNGSDTAAGT